jgi:rhodanese-related sulfurtransferase
MRRVLLAALFAVITCGPGGSITDVGQAEVKAIVESGGGAALLLDVRTPAEFAAGHVPGARNVPHTELAARIAEIAPRKADAVVVYCESGRRAAIAADVLVENGFTSVRHLEGDMAGWRDADLPIER